LESFVEPLSTVTRLGIMRQREGHEETSLTDSCGCHPRIRMRERASKRYSRRRVCSIPTTASQGPSCARPGASTRPRSPVCRHEDCPATLRQHKSSIGQAAIAEPHHGNSPTPVSKHPSLNRGLAHLRWSLRLRVCSRYGWLRLHWQGRLPRPQNRIE
jgi:hypothetical protein